MKKQLLSLALLLSAVAAHFPSLNATNLRNPIQSKLVTLKQQLEKAQMQLNALQKQEKEYLSMVSKGIDMEDMLEQTVTSIESTIEKIHTLQQAITKLGAIDVRPSRR